MPKFQVPADFNIGDPTNHENYRNGQSGLDALKKELDVLSGVYIIGIKANISDDGTIINRPDDEKKFINECVACSNIGCLFQQCSERQTSGTSCGQ